MNQLPKPGMLFVNPLFRTIYLVLDMKYPKQNQSILNGQNYFVIYVLNWNNKITGYGVPKKDINNLFDFLNWKVIE